MLDWIFNLLGVGSLLTQLTDSLILIGLTLFAIALGFFAIWYLYSRRKMLHQERMATLIKGLHYAGVAQQVFNQPRRLQSQPREHVHSALRWMFGGVGVSAAMYGYQSMQGAGAGEPVSSALVGVIPGALGIAHLVFAWIAARRQKKAATPVNRLNRRFVNPNAAVAAASYRPAYRPAQGRRF
jgi:hypothetical protein